MRLSVRRLFKGYYKFCQCGCKYLIPCINKMGRLAKFEKGHQSRGINNPCHKRDLKGMNNNNWKGGRVRDRNYWYLTIPDYFSSNKQGRVYEHIYNFQEYWQCCLLPWGQVHHIIPVSKDYCNNMPWNLMGMMEGKHQSFHRSKIF